MSIIKEKLVLFSDRAVYWSIVALPFLIMFGPALAFSAIGIMTVFFFVKKIVRRDFRFISTPVNLPFLLLIIVSVLSIRNSLDLADSINGVRKLISSGLIFLICAEEIKDKKHMHRIFISIASACVLVGLDAVWQVKTGFDFLYRRPLMIFFSIPRATAAFRHPNTLGVYLCAFAPFLTGMALYYYKGRVKVLMLAASALAVAGLFFSYSRSAGLGFFIAVLLISIVKRDKVIIGSLLAILLIFPFVMPQKIKDWAKKVNYNPVVFMLNPERISIYRNTVNMIAHHPVIGVGVNTFSRNYPLYKLPEAKGAETPETIYGHNIYLHMAAETGLLGLCMFLWMLFGLFKSAIRSYSGLPEGYLKTAGLCVASCCLAFLINGLTETNLYNPRIAMIFWLLSGMSLAFIRFLPAPEKNERTHDRT